MRSWCFDSVATEVDGVTTYDREYGSAEFREVMRKLVGDGVYANPANNMQVTAGGGLTVSVLPGYCWIKGALGIVDEAETLAIDATTKGRTDLIVARFDLSLAARDIHLTVVKGTEGSADAPALTRNDSTYDICLARVRVGASETAITPANITDTRLDNSLCGIVTGVVDQIDATDLFAQYEGIFDDFMQQLEAVLSGDVAGNLLALINNHTANRDNPHNVTVEQIGAAKKSVLRNTALPLNAPGETAVATCEVSVDATAFLVDIPANYRSFVSNEVVTNVSALIPNSPTSVYYAYHDGAKTNAEFLSITVTNGVLTVTNRGLELSARNVNILEIH